MGEAVQYASGFGVAVWLGIAEVVVWLRWVSLGILGREVEEPSDARIDNEFIRKAVVARVLDIIRLPKLNKQNTKTVYIDEAVLKK